MTDTTADNRDGDIEVINDVNFTHHFVEAGGIKWHYVETGGQDTEPVVFLHGAPECWYSWHYQMESLAKDFHAIAVDLKGYGQTGKPDESYQVDFIAGQISAMLSAAGVKRYNLATHDWGTMVGDQLAFQDHDRILRYLRMEGWVLIQDIANVPHVKRWKEDQAEIISLMSNADQFVRMVYKNTTRRPVPEDDLRRIVGEFSRDGVARAVPRYFRDIDLGMGTGDGLRKRAAMFAGMTFPVLLLQADSDPLQPQAIFSDAEKAFPNATLRWVNDSGHFTELEQPQQVTQSMLEFIGRTPV